MSSVCPKTKTEECLRWAREGSELYQRRYPGKLDYVSKFNEAFILCVSGACEEASKVFEEIIDNLDSKPWKAKGTDAHPAALNRNPQYDYFTHKFQCLCYQQMAVQSGRGKKKTNELIELVNKEEAECQSLLAQREYTEMFSYERDRLREAFEHAAKNKWEEGYEASTFLNISHAHFKTKYRQSYESGTPDEGHFLSAELCLKKLLKLNYDFLGPIDQSRTRTFMDLVRLHHEKDRQVMFFKQSSNVEKNAPILQYVKVLLRHTKHDDYWEVAQELYSDLYYMLQFHYFAKWIASHGCILDSTCLAFPDRLQQLWNQSLMSEGASAESSVSQEIWKQALIWAERRDAKTIYFQLAPNMLSSSAMGQLYDFVLNDDVAWNTLKSSRAACGPGTFVLEYFVSEKNDLQFVYVMTKEDEVFMQILKINGLHSNLWKILKSLRNMCSQGSHECERAFINGILEWLYEILINPVVNFLDDMEQEDKLIIVAPEILSDVPFAALRKPNSPVGEGYLIQSHTISVTPSLRTLQDCNQQWKELDQNFLITNPGTIVAVAEPAYENNGKETEVPKMSPMGEEVNFIEELFGEGHVKKLVGPEATLSEVLKWAKYPSEHLVKQVVFHIAAHVIGQDDGQKVKKDTAGQGATRTAQDKIFAATRIQQKYRGWKQRRDFLDLRQRVVKLQAQVRGNQVRKRFKKLLWSVGILEKTVLRWRWKGAGLRGFKSGELLAPDTDDDDDEELIKDGRKKNEAAAEMAVTRVQSMVHSRQARAEYFRLRDGSLQQGKFSQLASPQKFQSSTEEQLVIFAHDETELEDLFSMVDGKEEAQISSHGEVGGIRTGFVRPISKLAPHILKSENISGCGFPWKPHMVVLGACDTARGQITGEGVLNLPRALMIAGVPCVVVSQWKVGDSSTCELMKGFYQELKCGKDVSSSLRAAMLKMIKDGARVHEWAPFFVCGLPTVRLPKELQAGTSSCKVHDCGTSSDTKAELRTAHEMNEPSKLEPNCGASSSRSLPPILQQSLRETAGRTTDPGEADTEFEQIGIELEACVQQDGNGKQCKDEAAGRQAQKLLSSVHQRLQGLKRAIGVIPTPADYIVEDHCVQPDPQSVITFGWRVASEANALELIFQSAKDMSSILGVGVEFAKVLVVLASLEVKIVGIGQASWDVLWQDSSNNKDDDIDLVSIAGVRRAGAKLENPSNVEYLTAKQSATKYGVGLKNKSNTAHVNCADVKPQSDCFCILDKVVEYLVLKKVIGAVMDKPCDGDEGQESSSGVGSTKPGIADTSSSQSLLMSNLSLHRWQKPTGGSDDDDDDETLPSRKQPHQVNHKRPTGNFCRVTVRPGPGGSFDRAGIPQELDTASIDPTLVFEFNYKHDMNGDICDKQIQIITTTSFDLGEAAPTELMSDSFGWYQNPLEVSLRNCGRAELYSPNCELKGTPKETKISAKTTDTHSTNATHQYAAQVQGGCKPFIQVIGSVNEIRSNGETIAKETASENLVSEVLKGFQGRDLRVVKKSKLKYRFYRLPPPIRVVEDLEERHKYLGMGMCETVVPTFIGTWSITDADADENSPYMFDAERTLNRIFKVGQVSEESEQFVQCYRVPMYVNHAMSHLCTLKHHHTLKEREILSNVLEVGIVGI